MKMGLKSDNCNTTNLIGNENAIEPIRTSSGRISRTKHVFDPSTSNNTTIMINNNNNNNNNTTSSSNNSATKSSGSLFNFPITRTIATRRTRSKSIGIGLVTPPNTKKVQVDDEEPIEKIPKVNKSVTPPSPMTPPSPPTPPSLPQPIENNKNSKLIESQNETPFRTVGACAICNLTELDKNDKFVMCRDCPTKVHLVCLKSLCKFFSQAEELSWLCEECESCHICRETSINVPLYKCFICLSSYHMICHDPTGKLDPPKIVHKNRFRCNQCVILDETIKKQQKPMSNTPPPTATAINSTALRKNQSATSSELDESITRPRRSRIVPVKLTITPKKAPVVKTNELPSVKKRKLIDGNLTTINGRGRPPTKHLKKRMIVNKIKKKKNFMMSSLSSSSSLSLSVGSVTVKPAHTTLLDESVFSFDLSEVYGVPFWSCDKVFRFIQQHFPDEAFKFKEQEIDGLALLLLQRSDITTQLKIKLGPALKIHELILRIQSKYTK